MADEKNISTAKGMSATQAEIDQLNLETARLNFQIAQEELKAKQQALVELQYKNEEQAQRRAVAQARQRNAVESDLRLKQDRERKQAYCNHSQGGEGLEGMFQGEGVHTTYQKETTITGHEFYRCVRCEKEVFQFIEPQEFKRISKLAHKGLKGPVPILFKFVDGNGQTVLTDQNGKPLAK